MYFDCPSHQTVTSHEGNEDEKPERPRLSSSDLPPTYSRARLDHMLSEGQYEITPLPHLNNILPPSRDLATLPKRKSSSHGKIRPQATSRPSWAIPSPVKPSLSLDLVTHAKACWVWFPPLQIRRMRGNLFLVKNSIIVHHRENPIPLSWFLDHSILLSSLWIVSLQPVICRYGFFSPRYHYSWLVDLSLLLLIIISMVWIMLFFFCHSFFFFTWKSWTYFELFMRRLTVSPWAQTLGA